MTAFPQSDLEETVTIGAAELKQLQGHDHTVRVLDVRSGGEFEAMHIPGSHCIPLDVLDDQLAHIAAIDRPLVLVCHSGARASQAHAKLQQAGKARLHILDGGIASWQSAGEELNRGGVERWAMDRQVRLAAGALVSAGIIGSTVFPPAKWIAGAIGAGLTYSALSDSCAMAAALSKLPYNRDKNFDFSAALASLDG